MDAYLQSVTYRPVRNRDGSIAHCERLTHFYGGRSELDTISAADYQAVCDQHGIGALCDALDAAADPAIAALIHRYGGRGEPA